MLATSNNAITSAKYHEPARRRRAFRRLRWAPNDGDGSTVASARERRSGMGSSTPGRALASPFHVEQSLALQLGGGLQAELGLDLLAVGANGLGAEIEVRSDLPRGQAGADQQENLHLSIGEVGEAHLRFAMEASREDAGIHSRAEHDLAPQHRIERLHDAVQVGT